MLNSEQFDDRFGWCPPVADRAPSTALVAPRADVSDGAPIMTSSQMESWGDLFGWNGPTALSAARAMRHSAVYACVRVLGGAISTLPLKIYSDEGGSPKYEPKHPLARLLRARPNPRMSSAMLWRASASEAVLNGNAYIWIQRNRSGAALALWHIPQRRCDPVLLRDGGVAYRVTLDDGRQVAVPGDDVLHLPGSMQWDGLRALSPLSAAAGAVGLGLEADEYAQRFFANSATPSGYLAYEKSMKNETIEQLREYWHDRFSGANRGKVAVLTDGGKFTPIALNMEDAQLLETRRFQIEDIARIYGVPPHMIGALDKTTSWGSGIEQQAIGFVVYSLQMHLTAFEQEIEAKLFDDGSGMWAEFDVRGLMRGDFKARTEGYRAALGGSNGAGFMTVNEVRKLENLPPVEGGEKLTTWTQAASAPPAPSAPDEGATDEQPPADDPPKEKAASRKRRSRQ